MFDYVLLVVGVIVVGYFLHNWIWEQGFRRGYMAGMTDTQQAVAEQLGRLLKKGGKDA